MFYDVELKHRKHQARVGGFPDNESWITRDMFALGIPVSCARRCKNSNTVPIMIPSTSVNRAESKAARYLNAYGSESTH